MKGLIKRLRKNKKGFTLIELIVVIAIIGVLMAILIPSMTGYVRNSRITTANANARQVFQASQTFLTFIDGQGTPVTAAGSIDGSATGGTITITAANTAGFPAAVTDAIIKAELERLLGTQFDGFFSVSFDANGAVNKAVWSQTLDTAPANAPVNGAIGNDIVGMHQ